MSDVVTGREQRVLEIIETARSKRARFRDKQITLAHGAGGKATQTLIEGLLVPAFGETGPLAALADAGAVALGDRRLAMTSDSFVVKPLRFPGGSIGELAVNGTVNDLAMAGARAAGPDRLDDPRGGPGHRRAALPRCEAIAAAARAAGVEIVGGDTKVVERGAADGMYLITTGVGEVDARAGWPRTAIRPGDRVLVSGPIGEHGTAIMLARDQFDLDAELESDTCSLWPAVDALLAAAGAELHCLRDATRGGVASVLNELARASGIAVVVRRGRGAGVAGGRGGGRAAGDRPDVRGQRGPAGGLRHPGGRARGPGRARQVDGCEQAAEIGEVRAEPPGMVMVNTAFGGRRVMDQLVGDPLPRIC